MRGLLHDKVVLVTGAASGIGRAACLLFAREGAQVLAADINQGGAADTSGLIEATGARSIAVRVDVSDAVSVDAMVAAALSAFGRLDGAFNNAGLSGHKSKFTRLAEYPDEDFQRLIAVNQMGVWHCMRAELRCMVAAGGGAIVNTSSIAGARAFAGSAAYSATKHAVVGMTRTAAMEYASKNIRVNAVLPGGVETPMNQDMPNWQEIARRTQPMRRVGRPEEIAEAACWLLSDRASFVTAQLIHVDGGWTEALGGA
jgi:NAD(P)-dependent dehydrogenase (short-subunit alcohol dehydrogenase family)